MTLVRSTPAQRMEGGRRHDQGQRTHCPHTREEKHSEMVLQEEKDQRVRPASREVFSQRDKMIQKVRAGVVGVGQMGRYHVSVYSELFNTELVGVADCDQHRVTAIA